MGLVLAITPSANAWQSTGRGDNPPLLYDGPDPTADYFLSPRVAWNQPQPPPFSEGESADAAVLAPWVGPNLNSADPWGITGNKFIDEGLVSRGVTDSKEGFFQRLGASDTWIDRGSSSDFGLNEVDLYAMFALPAPNREWPLLITPTFNPRFIDGPVAPELPPQIFEAYVDFLWLPRLSDRWTAIIGIAPSYYGDFKVSADKAFRFTGKGLAKYDWSPGRVQLLFGVLYLNRENIRLLPAGGIIWTPDESRRYELLFPKPKLAHRIVLGHDFEDWLYLGAEFGGNTFGVEYDNGTEDSITLLDYRVYIGLERKLNGGAGYRLEAGYVFGRRVQFDSGLPDLEVGSAAMLRGGFTY